MAVNSSVWSPSGYDDVIDHGNASTFEELLSFDNDDHNGSHVSTGSNSTVTRLGLDTLTVVFLLTNGAICVVGLAGNAMVLYVIGRYTRMKTVTNVYILNLSLTDSLFLVGLPMLMTTTVIRRWVFGAAMCRVYFALTSVNMFTGSFTLTLMSADRFTAVWYPVSSLRYRTPRNAAILSGVAWVVSLAVMFPVVMYAEQVPMTKTAYTCTVQWPGMHAAQVYIGYTSAVGFAIPVTFICVFYALLVIRLRATRRHIRSATSSTGHQRKVRRSVTFLVTSVITVFIVCWLPYWAFQVHLVFSSRSAGSAIQVWKIYLFQFFTALSYINSAVNPFLYAFTNEGFKTSFATACGCITNYSMSIAAPSAAEQNTKSNTPGSRRRRLRAAAAARNDDRPLTLVTRGQVTGNSQFSRACGEDEPEAAGDVPVDRRVLAQIEEKELLDNCEGGSDRRLMTEQMATDCL